MPYNCLGSKINNRDQCKKAQKKASSSNILHACFSFARQRPSLTKGNPSLQSALRSLTSVFEMGTGVTFLPSSPHIFQENLVLSKLNLQN